MVQEAKSPVKISSISVARRDLIPVLKGLIRCTKCINKYLRVIKSRRMRWEWHVARLGEGRGVYRVLVGKPEGKRPLGRPRRRWEDNIKMDLQ
jgi:hypothetical protein